MIAEGQCNTPGHSPTFTSADPALVKLLKTSVAVSGLGEVTYRGRYGYRLVNHRGRGGVAARSCAHEWLQRYGLNVGSADKFVPQQLFRAPASSVRLFLQSLFTGDGGLYRSEAGVVLEYYSKSRRLSEDVVQHLLLRFGVLSVIREKITAIGTLACKIQITDKEQVRRFAERIGFAPGSLRTKAPRRTNIADDFRATSAAQQFRHHAQGRLGRYQCRRTQSRDVADEPADQLHVPAISSDECGGSSCKCDR